MQFVYFSRKTETMPEIKMNNSEKYRAHRANISWFARFVILTLLGTVLNAFIVHKNLENDIIISFKVDTKTKNLELYFKDLGCKNALYLDGFVSRAYLPEKNWIQTDGNFGVMIGVTEFAVEN
jgi:hypothetical protein